MDKKVRLFGLFGMVIFAITGLLFLFFPESVVSFFNSISRAWALKQQPALFPGFYLILAVGYMYMVAFLSYEIFQNPANPIFLLLLANAKIASSLLSLLLIIGHGPYLIYGTNLLVDGLIGFVALYLYLKVKK